MNSLKTYYSPDPFVLESGEIIPELTIAYHTFGTSSKKRDNVVWVFHALTANSDVTDWWKGLFGKNCLFNPQEYFIICANTLGSPYGSTAPKDLDFPQFGIRDVVNAHYLLAKKLGIDRIHTAIGGSFGGNQALEFSYAFNGVIEHLVLVASCSRESAWGIAVHESQRIALQSDPTFGSAEGGESGMKAARSMAMLTYRTAEAFINQQTDSEETTDNFKASSYLQYQGDKFVKRFNALSYYYLTKCLDSHNIGRNRGGETKALSDISIPTLVIGISSDVLISPRFQKFMVEHLPNARYEEISSDFGHDGFLVEVKKITKKIQDFYGRNERAKLNAARVVMKFGGKSLSNGSPLESVLQIIEQEAKQNALAVIVSARGESTDQLLALYELACKGENFETNLSNFIAFQEQPSVDIDLSAEKTALQQLLNALSLLKVGNEKTKNQIVAFGEIISAKLLTALLQAKGLEAVFVDARQVIMTQENLRETVVNSIQSKELTNQFFDTLSPKQIPIITGFIAKDEQGHTTTLGRNGSNYSATLIASYIRAKEVQNWTNIDGIYSASPKYVSNARKIDHMSYREANELANFGTNILHSKTILPLLQSNIPLRIKNSFEPETEGTLIDKNGSDKGIKAVSVIEDVSLVSIEGRGLLGKVGIDARIFTALSRENISVRLISQASSERGIGFVINQEDTNKTELILNKEFEEELKKQHISSIQINGEMAIIAIVGRHNFSLEKAIQGLRKNRIWMHLISNSISGEHISLVIDNKKLKKAVNVVHNQVFGAIKTLNVFAFGKGTVGGKLIDQLLETSETLVEQRNLKINVIGIADSKQFLFQEEGIGTNWRTDLQNSQHKSDFASIMQLLRNSSLENIVVVDNTASIELTRAYLNIIRYGFDLVASNKKANSIDYDFYEKLRKELKRRGRLFYYETNVGAGLPIIETIKNLQQSSDTITRIKGVFSGSLSYLFNHYSVEDSTFSEVLAEAKKKGYTEPDPREDLSGMDVARKLIILAREVGLKVEYDEVEIEGLIPKYLLELKSYAEFLEQSEALNDYFNSIKSALEPEEVLRYVGELDVEQNQLKVSLIKASRSTPLGNIQNADSIFEIYTKGYGSQPIIIQGAGVGAEVTARGVYSDLLKIGLQV